MAMAKKAENEALLRQHQCGEEDPSVGTTTLVEKP